MGPELFAYYVCADCGHVETRPLELEPPARCEHCRVCTSFWVCDDLDAAEGESQSILDDGPATTQPASKFYSPGE